VCSARSKDTAGLVRPGPAGRRSPSVIIVGVIDWSVAERLATLVAGGRSGDAALVAGLADVARESERVVGEYTTLRPGGPLPAAEALSRADWARMNLHGFRPLLDPTAERLVPAGLGPVAGPIGSAAGFVIAAEVGLLTGYLSQRVLGQYELALLEPAAPSRLVFVTENLEEAVRTLDVDGEELLRWIALHEVTHAFEFSGAGWLREHLAGLVRELLDALDIRVDPRALLRLPSGAELRGWAEALRREGLVAVVASPRQREVLDRVQALMALLEGYSEHVMDAVGARLLRTLPELRAAMERRRRSRSGPERLLQRLIGLDLKIRQYEVGKRFCDAVVADVGIAGLDRVWASPRHLPSAEELAVPANWVRRTHVPAVTKSAHSQP
jgi:coenzyme F420 biosynthesis associated uncharacterized protein